LAVTEAQNLKKTIMSKIDQLKYLLEKNKFSYSEWEKRGLNPSASELCEYLENNLNSCLNSLIDKTENNASQKELKKTLSLNLRSLNKSNLDTEEKEFVCDYYNDF
jgi:type I site-specific restriction-modification system R (restriction) subunit